MLRAVKFCAAVAELQEDREALWVSASGLRDLRRRTNWSPHLGVEGVVGWWCPAGASAGVFPAFLAVLLCWSCLSEWLLLMGIYLTGLRVQLCSAGLAGVLCVLLKSFLSKLLLAALCPGFWRVTAVLWCHAKCYLSPYAPQCLLKRRELSFVPCMCCIAAWLQLALWTHTTCRMCSCGWGMCQLLILCCC